VRTRALATTPEQMHSRRPIPSLVAAHQRALIASCETSGCLQVGQRSAATSFVSVLEFATKAIVVNWPIPGGGSPDMGNVSADGKVLARLDNQPAARCAFGPGAVATGVV